MLDEEISEIEICEVTLAKLPKKRKIDLVALKHILDLLVGIYLLQTFTFVAKVTHIY